MTKAEKNYKRDYGHKDSEELDKALSEVSPDNLSEDEKEYLDGRNQCRNHTLNIRFNDTEWEHITKQADLLKMKKSSYVRECTKAHYVLMLDQDDMDNIVKAVRALSTNVNQIARRTNSTGRIYSEDIRMTKESVNEIWRLLNYIQSASLEYIVDGNKTRNHTLVESFMCETDPVRAAEQFRAVRERFGTGRSTTQAQHIIQSFAPGEVTPEKAMEIAQELCHRLLKEQYQYVIAIHTDHDHCHAHIIVNNTNMVTGKTFETEHNQGKKSNRAWAEIRSISDELCRENDLSVIQHPETSKGKSYWEWDTSRQGLSWKAKLKYAIDQVVKDSEDFKGFLSKCAAHGILVEYNPDNKIDLKFMLAEQKENNPRAKMTRSKTLGWYYETEQIKSRIAQYKGEMIYTPRIKVRVTVQKATETDKNKFIRDAIDRNNMKLTSKAMNILSKYSVTVDEAKDAAVAAFAERTSLVGKLNNINEEIKAREEHLFWLTHYLDVKPFHDKYMSLKGRKQQKYADRFNAELYRYSVWESDLKKEYPKKFPTVKQLEDYIEKLKGKRDKKNAEYVIAD